MATATRSNRQPPVVRDAVLQAIAQSGGKANSVGLRGVCSPAYLHRLATDGFLTKANSEKVTPGPGRPAVNFKLTNKGRGRVRTLAKRAA